MSTATIIAAGQSADFTSFALIRYLADGSRDTTFGTGGLVLTSFGVDHQDQVSGVAVQADGKIVAVGPDTNVGGDLSFAVARYNADGTLDTGFGTGGLFTTNFGGGDVGAFPTAVAIQGDGKIVVVGTQQSPTPGWGIIRLLTDGTLDAGFGTGGKIVTVIDGDGNTFDAAFAVAIQGNGKIVVAGAGASGGDGAFCVARYNTDGTLDLTGFGTFGTAVTTFGAGYFSVDANGVVIQGDGKIVAAGSVDPDGTHSHFAFVRYNADGTLDTVGFGTGGKTQVSFTSPSFLQSLAIQGDGKLVAAGFTGTPGVFALVRLDTAGVLDTSFDTDGKLTTDFSSSGAVANAIVIEDDGLLVVAGIANEATTATYGLARYHTDGTLDTSFDTDGLLTDAGAILASAVALSAPLTPTPPVTSVRTDGKSYYS